jgi:DHA2 family methylenomycin A resistance protein-like MFS transporter
VCGLAGTAELLVAGRVMQGVGGAFVCPAALAAITVTFTGADRARALAGWSAAGAAALAVGPLVGGALTAAWSWPAVFLVPVPVCVGAVVVAARWLPPVVPGPRVIGRFPLRLVVFPNLVLALGSAAMVAACYTCTLWLQVVLGHGPMATGLVFLPLSLGILLGAFLAPRLLRQLTASVVAVLGLVVASVGMLLLAALPLQVAPVELVPALVVLAVGFGLQSVPICALATSVRGDQALAAAVYQTAGQLGGGLGLVGLGLLSGRGWAFVAGALALVLGALLVRVFAGSRGSRWSSQQDPAQSQHGDITTSQTCE